MTYASRARTGILGPFVSRTAAVPPATGVSADLFSTTGEVLLTGFFGLVTFAIPNAVLSVAIDHDPDGGGSDVALGTAVSIQNKGIGNYVVLNATAGGVLVVSLDASYGVQLAVPIALTAGDIKVTTSGGGAIGATARIKWGVTYVPLTADGSIVAV
jgi:hypothetical protein